MLGSAAGIFSPISAGCENVGGFTNQQIYSFGVGTVALEKPEMTYTPKLFEGMRVSNPRKGKWPHKPSEAQILDAFLHNETAVIVHDDFGASHEVSIIIAAIWDETMPPEIIFTDPVCQLSCSVAVIVGFAVNIYMAVNKKRFEHEKTATEQSYQRRLRHFADHINDDLVHDRETLAQKISRLSKREIIECLPKPDYEKPVPYPNSERQISICHHIEVTLVRELNGSPSYLRNIYSEEDCRELENGYDTTTSASGRYDHAYQCQAKIYASPMILSDRWYDLWHFMSVESGRAKSPYHLRVIGDLMSVISNELLHYNDYANLLCLPAKENVHTRRSCQG
ncbi:hypothetical protein JCM33374_g6309 [Metschnikowia sp. JCM 33374]|nr:hypothetical protein JCM33374_g6309 [Metschnikowia sp. JCM 33374]